MPSYRAWRIRLSGRTIEKSEIEKKKMKERERRRRRPSREEVVFDIDSISSIHLADKLFFLILLLLLLRVSFLVASTKNEEEDEGRK